MHTEEQVRPLIEGLREVLPAVDEEHSPESPETDSLQSEDFQVIATDVATSLCAGLSNTEKNALNVSGAVDQVMRLNGHDQYCKAVEMIFNDPSLCTEEKLRLKAEEDARQDHKDERAVDRVTRIQASQTKDLSDLLRQYAAALGIGAGSAALFVLCGTKTGRTLMNRFLTWIQKEAPHLFQQAFL